MPITASPTPLPSSTSFAVAAIRRVASVDPLRDGGAPPGGIDREPERRVGLQHALVSDRQPVPMVVEIGRVDGEQGFVAGVGVAVVFAAPVTGGRLDNPAGPLRDGAFGVPRPFPPEGGEVAAEPLDLVGGDLGRGGSRESPPEGEGAPEGGCGDGGSKGDSVHVHGPGAQNEYLTEAAMKSRSLS